MIDTTKKPMRLIATYSRVSTSHQEDEGTIENQLTSLREHSHKNGFTIVKEYIDNGWSGDMLARPALDELRQGAKEKLWDAVLIYDPDRLARRYSYQELVMDELREAGIEVMFITVSSPKNSEDKILHGVRGLFAEYERAKITERFRLGKLRKVKEGHVLVSEAPYGYDYIAKRDGLHGYYKVNPDEASVVKMIFEWVAGGSITLKGIVKKLHELGIKPRKSKRGVWNTSTLSTLLRNRAYIGEARWGSSYAIVPENPVSKEKYRKIKKTSRKIRPQEEWIIIPVPSIIDKELFARTRTQLEANFALCRRNKKNEYLLGGKMHCICGRKRTGEGPQRGKHLYYRCSDRVASFPLPAACHERGINARIADKLVWQKIANLMSSPRLLSKQIDRWVGTKRTKTRSTAGDVALVEKEMAKLKAQEDRYNKAYGAGLFTIEQLKEYTTSLRESMSALESQVVKAKQEERELGVELLPSQHELQEFASVSSEALRGLSFAEKRAIVMSAVEKVVGTQQQLQVSGYIPVISHVEYKTNDRHRRLAQRGEVNAL